MSQREDALKFETGRIKALQEERLHIQKKTFTKWMNSFLSKARMDVDDLFIDLADGKRLLKLLEIISGEKLGKPNNGKMRVHKIENVNKSLAFLHTKVRLESIGAEDIVDGNPRLILGLIWTIILRFQIQEIEIDVDEENESSEKRRAKDALLLWCQRRTNGYSGVNIQDFTGSWRNGLGFNALIHAHRPDLIDYDSLVPSRHIDNLNNAFDVAEAQLGIQSLLDAEDIDTAKPDEKSVLTYVASYYHTFARMKNEMKGGRRIANIVGQIMDADKLKGKYEKFTTDLLEWISATIEKLNDRTFPNSLEGIQKELQKFKDYRTIEKPPKYNEKSEIEVCYFNINTRLKELNQPLYNPPDGKLIHDVSRAWEALEKAENQRELSLRDELLRQTHLEQLAERFEKKSALREGYLKDMILVLSDSRYGVNLVQVEATLKKHEAISADILAREERCAQLTTMADYLVNERYNGQDRIRKRADEIMNTWNKLLELLESHRLNLGTFSNLMALLREIDTMNSTIQELEEGFQSDVGLHHLLGVEDLLQKHSLLESQTSSIGETLKRLTRQATQYVAADLRESPMLQERLAKLAEEYAKLLKLAKERRAKLEDSRSFFQFVQDHEEEEAWLTEKQRICNSGISAKDLRAVISLQQKHKAVLDEMKARLPKSNQIIEAGQELLSSNPPESKDIKARIDSLQKSWNALREAAAAKEKKLKEAAEAYQFYADANEADSWILEKRPLVASTDYGEDEPSAQALLQRNKTLQEEIKAYEVDIKGINTQAEKLIKSGISTLNMQEPEPTVEEEWVQEQKLLPVEFYEDEPVERVEYKTVTEERAVPQVKALYAFQGQDIDVAKGEVMFLLNKTNNDWWNVRQGTAHDGFVPANYVKEIEPKVIQVQARKPETIRELKRVKKTKMVLQNVMVKKTKSPRSTNRSGKRPSEDNEPVEKRQSRVNTGYQDIVNLAKKRHDYLADSIHLFGFYRECDTFEKWIREKLAWLQTDEKGENVESAKRKFEQFLNSLSASSKRVDQIDKQVEDFAKANHSQMDKIILRQKQIHHLWDQLNHLKVQKERSLEGASSVELFNRTCDEARDWMLEKMLQIDSDDMGQDLKTVQSLQRRHQNLEREVSPIEDKVNRVNLLANSVCASYPNEKQNVSNRQKEIQELWEQLKAKAIDRRARLEEAVGQQIFMMSSANLLRWVADSKEIINSNEEARDVSTAEAFLKDHSDLGDTLRMNEDEFEEVIKLGNSLMSKNPSPVVQDRLVELQNERAALHRGWQEKGDWLQQQLDLQMFNREADSIASQTSGHLTYLQNEDLGKNLLDVTGLLKRHNDFENTLNAQDDRIRTFSEMANKLIDARHYDSKKIDERRNQVLAARQAVKDRAKERKAALDMSLKYEEFKTDVDDMKVWIGEKTETASDESYKDLQNLERKIQKHEAFVREIRANEARLRQINRAGQKLKETNYKQKEIEKQLDDLNESWANLLRLSEAQGNMLRQADAQHSYYKTLENVREKLDEMESQLKSKDYGSDRRACKEMVKKHDALEADITQWDIKIEDLVNLGNDMVAGDHFDAKNINKQSEELRSRLNNLKDPAEERKAALQSALKYYDFIFEVNAQLQWIKEHLAAVMSEQLPQDLHQAQNLFKKHRKLEAEIEGHEHIIVSTLAVGEKLVEQKHPETKDVKSQCKNLKDAWKELKDASKERNKRLDLALKAQQFFNDASEVETWLNEKNNVLSSRDFGNDTMASVALLTKHKALELEMDSYSGLVNEMGNMAQAMVKAKHPDSKIINNKQESIVQQLKNLQTAANVRRKRLMETMQRHEYFAESIDFEKWMDDQVQTAISEEFGHDYEHLLMLQSKFNDFKIRVESSSERFEKLDELAKKLISSENSYSNDMASQNELQHDDIPQLLVSQKHEIICDKWNNLLAHIDARDVKLRGAGEIHRFHRDVSDALARIQEKSSAIPEGVGKDVNSCESMLRQHETFENDLLALEAQLQVLVDDAAKLQELYPTNAENIKHEQTAVIHSWNELKNRSAQKKEELTAACDFHRFSSAVRDLMNWAALLQTTMLTQEKVRNSAQTLIAEHERLKGEIEAREEKFQNVNNLGQSMIQDGHSASAEVKDRLDILSREKERLMISWEKKKIYLDQLMDLELFLRDAKLLDTICSSQEIIISSQEVGSSVEEVEGALRKHDAVEKLIATQEDKFELLQAHGEKLIRQNHFESNTVKHRIHEVIAHRNQVKDLCKAKRARLDEALLYAQFMRDVTEGLAWIEERKKKLEFEASQSTVVDLEAKIKKLKKHQAFESELAANEPVIHHIVEKGNVLKQRNHKNSREIDEQLKVLVEEWNKLLKESKSFGHGLDEAQDILDFNNQVEKIEAWLRDKELLVGAGDLGRDYEHCVQIQKKLDDVNSDLMIEDGMKNINELADKLLAQQLKESSTSTIVEDRKNRVNSKWKNLTGALRQYKEQLAGALEIHAFNRDVDDTKDRIQEKMVNMSGTDTGKDLDAVEALIRKQETLDRDVSAISKKLGDLTQEQDKLSKKRPESAKAIQEKLQELDECWAELSESCLNRRQILTESLTFQKFIKKLKELEFWVEDTVAKLNSGDLPNSTAEAEALILQHEETKAEIHARKENFDSLTKLALRLIKESHSSEPELSKCVEHISILKDKLNKSCAKREEKLKDSHQLQIFNFMADNAESILRDNEAFLNNDDLGDSIAAVDALVRKHNNFEQNLEVQQGRLEELQKFGDNLVDKNHYASSDIKKRLKAIETRQKKLKKNSSARQTKLKQSRELLQFSRNAHDLQLWMEEKMQIATEETYRDATNLQSKLQQHQSLESELAAEGRISGVVDEGEALLSTEKHFAASEIATILEELRRRWRQLQDAASLKKKRLEEAYQFLLFKVDLDDLEIWMDEIEQQLASEDHGKDLTSGQHLLKKWQHLERDYNHHSEQIDQIKKTSTALEKANHFLKDEICQRVETIVKRYNQLQEPLHIRKDNLEDALKLYQFLNDVDDEIIWIKEKQPVALSKDLGSSLPVVQSLLKKVEALESEILTHESFVVSLASRGQQLIRAKHFASEQVSQKIKEMEDKLAALKIAASVRKLRLVDATHSQAFYAEVSEAETWINENRPYFASTDFGKDENASNALLKKLEVLSLSLSAFGKTIEKLQKQSKELVEKHHFDSENIEITATKIKESYVDLQKLDNKRRQRLTDQVKLFKFLRDSDDFAEWIQDQMNVAASEDYGRDYEHVVILLQKFDNFMTTVNNAGENRIIIHHNAAQQFADEKHPETDKVIAKSKEITQMWEDFKELANAREEALQGAKHIHIYDRNSDETISWIGEKDAVLRSEDFGHDLESVQALVRKQQTFERDLTAVKDKVDTVIAEAKRLAGLFPDAREHIEVKLEDTVEAWNELLERASIRKDKLEQAEAVQAYFDNYRELYAWVNETIAKVTAPELAKDVAGAESLISRHKDYQIEIEARKEAVKNFLTHGHSLIREGHFLADKIDERIKNMEQRWDCLLDIMKRRKEIYEQNLDSQLFFRDVHNIESWMTTREPILKDPTLGETIGEVEELLRLHSDFESTIDAQRDKLEELKRKTLIEESFLKQQQREQEIKIAESKRIERERVEAIKRTEVNRITELRKQEDEQRRQIEIKLNRDGTSNGQKPSVDKSEEKSRLGQFLDPGLAALRRGSDPGLVPKPKLVLETGGDVKRSESFKMEGKKPKRTPSFTTRRRTQSFRKLRMMENLQDLPPLEIEGFLERKHELQSGGKRAAVRSWKQYYVVLCGQLLCFFKDRQDFLSSKAGSTPILIYQAKCEKATDYTKRKHVYRLKPSDGSEYLFASDSEANMEDWIAKISFHAQLPPSQQLTSYDSQSRLGDGDAPAAPEQDRSGSAQATLSPPERYLHHHSAGDDGDASSSSSDSETPDTPRRALVQPRSREPVYANVDVLKDSEQQQPRLVQKPPIPPRSSSIDSLGRRMSEENSPNGSTLEFKPIPQPLNGNGSSNGNGHGHGNGSGEPVVDELDGQWKRHSFDRVKLGGPPPVPVNVNYPPGNVLPPGKRSSFQPQPPPPIPAGRLIHANNMNNAHPNPYHQVYAAGPQVAMRHDLRSSRTASLPPCTTPPGGSGSSVSNLERRQTATADRRRLSESSSESDSPTNPRDRDKKKSGGILGFLRKKKATQL